MNLNEFAKKQQVKRLPNACTISFDYQRPHDFQAITDHKSGQIVMFCSKCGMSFAYGLDANWHQVGYGATIEEMTKAETED